jgi:hypothetical protein
MKKRVYRVHTPRRSDNSESESSIEAARLLIDRSKAAGLRGYLR